MNERQSEDLVTERDNDPSFGLFTEEDVQGQVPDASDELRKIYPENSLIRVPQQPQYTETQSGAGENQKEKNGK